MLDRKELSKGHTYQTFLANQRQELLLSCEQLLEKVIFDFFLYMKTHVVILI